jgi:hypothetical protein
MYAVVRHLDLDEIEPLARRWMTVGQGDMEALLEFSAKSVPLIGCFMGQDLVGLGGVVPQDAFCNLGVLWMQHTHATPNYQRTLIRVSPLILEALHKRYSRLVGTCSLGPRSVRWLKSMGAKFVETNNVCKPFVIENQHG